MAKKLWHPPTWEKEDLRAIQSLALYAQEAVMPSEPGNAPPPPSAHDVKRALDFIIFKAAATYENSFVEGDPNGRIGAFMEGRRFVGQQIIKLMKLKPGVADGRTQDSNEDRQYREDG